MLLVYLIFCLLINAICIDARVTTRYVGCYTMKGENKFDGYVGIHLDLNLESCKFLCFNRGFPQAAFRNGSECSCGDVEDIDTLPKAKDCSVKCSGHTSQICGGLHSFSLYDTGIKGDVTVEDKRTGCLSDGSPERLIPEHKLDLIKTNTPKRCASICKSLGYKYAGVQKSYECYCGDISRTEPLIGGCTKECSGDQKQHCGGDWKMMVYRTGIQDGIPNTKAQYLACYKNKEGGLLRRYRFFHPKMDPLKCIAKCFLHGHPYSAVFNKTDCLCGPLPAPLPYPLPESECSSACPGDPSKKCGSPEHVSTYANGIVGNPVLGRSIGCFKDTEGTLITGYRINAGTKSSPQYCISKCIERGYRLAGVINTYECVCSNDYPKRVPPMEVLDTYCNSTCPQNSVYTCGGINHIQIYRTGLDNIFTVLKSCTKSVTEIGGNPTCKGDIVFDEKFEVLKFSKWQRTVRISGDEYEFVTYNSDETNSYVQNGHLAIRPTLMSDSFVYNGSITLKGCTGRLNTDECSQNAHSYSILHPVQSAELCTAKSFSFRYGLVTVRAKLPAGDWILPQIVLKPLRDVYGPRYISGKIIIARASGNADLRTSTGEDIGSKILTSGIMVGESDEPTSVKTSFAKFKLKEPWNAHFHNYTLVWSPDYIYFVVDNNVNDIKSVYNKGDKSLIASLGITGRDANFWKRGTHLAPFDEEFQICLGVSVGGSYAFPNGAISKGRPKPWGNTEVKGMLNFWKTRNDWLPSWLSDVKMYIDYVGITAL